MRRLLVALMVLAIVAAACTDDQESSFAGPATVAEQATTTFAETSTSVVTATSWDSILATRRAVAPPPAAVCDDESDQDMAGPVDQDRPTAGWVGNLAAAFDQHWGRIVYVDTTDQTWTFDVCTNSWTNMNPIGNAGGERSGGLVYDVDSDVTIALSFESVSFYDARINRWTQPLDEVVGIGDDLIVPTGAAYDPVSGLIITTDDDDLWAYDVDTNVWTKVGQVPQTADDFLGYSSNIDRLIFGSTNDSTVLVDPRTGAATFVETDSPVVNLDWPNAVYGPAHDSVYTTDWWEGDDYIENRICGLDTDTLAWSSCFDPPDQFDGGRHFVFGAIVGDLIHDRMVLINGIYGAWWAESVDDVWAIDVDTAVWMPLLAPSSQAETNAFSFTDDDLCEWVTGAEVAEFVAAEFDWKGKAAEVEAVNDPTVACIWELSGADGTSGSVTVHDGGLSENFDGNPYDYDARMKAEGVLDYQGPVCVGEFVAGHPALSVGVVVHNGAFGQFFFAVPPDTEWLLLYLDVPGRTVHDWTSCEGSITTGGVASDDYGPRLFAVADHFLEELGWLSAR